ncbi:hypothetical protein D3C85_1625440 [compost metagenome]
MIVSRHSDCHNQEICDFYTPVEVGFNPIWIFVERRLATHMKFHTMARMLMSDELGHNLRKDTRTYIGLAGEEFDINGNLPGSTGYLQPQPTTPNDKYLLSSLERPL